ncbi:DMT family transporter [Bacillus sp. MRMR6]|uniref:DMT family transporter n=1 Tax=Bacillus sp. MRMR6 TaxID=1928617 RepID=UPI0020CA012E|nr:DMT family transporter [Bacillus sp. MRMR6]
MAKGPQIQIYILLVFVMLSWGLNVTATKIVVAAFLPVTITALRIFTAAIAVFIILFFLKKIRIPTRSELGYIIIAAFLNVVGHHYFLSLGLAKTSASNGGLILGLGPILTTIAAFFFLKTRITFIQLFGIILGLTGVSFIVLIGQGGISTISIGDVYVFISIFTQAFSFVMIKKISNTLDPRLMTGYMLLIGSGILFLISLIQEPNGLSQLQHGSFGIWVIFLSSAVIATAIGHTIYNYAIGKVGVSEAAIFINLSPFFSLVGAAFILGERITMTQILGFLFIILGVLLGSGALEEFSKHIKKRMNLPYKFKSSI